MNALQPGLTRLSLQLPAMLITRARRGFGVLLASLLLVGCAGYLPEDVSIDYTPEQLVPEKAPFYSPGDVEELSTVDPLALDADMEAFLADVQQRSGSDRALLNNILRGLLTSVEEKIG